MTISPSYSKLPMVLSRENKKLPPLYIQHTLHSLLISPLFSDSRNQSGKNPSVFLAVCHNLMKSPSWDQCEDYVGWVREPTIMQLVVSALHTSTMKMEVGIHIQDYSVTTLKAKIRRMRTLIGTVFHASI
jgi:hypothetical protein